MLHCFDFSHIWEKGQKMKKVFILITVALLLTSCYDPRTVADESWEDIQVTLVEKYQVPYKGTIHNYFRVEFDGEILLEEPPDEVYYAYSEGDLVPMILYKAYNGHDGLLTVHFWFKIPKDKKRTTKGLLKSSPLVVLFSYLSNFCICF